ncbi:MAG: ribonuclease HII [Thermotogaceae bacterium]|nr:ribonuclease HII [Thermotogaceae bacterium]
MEKNFDEIYKNKYGIVAGADEAGRGPLAGPVVASVVILKRELDIVDDSKKLSAKNREEIYNIILENAFYGIGIATPAEIDILNILNATKLAIRRAIENLNKEFGILLIDGKKLEISEKSLCVIKGDSKSQSIAAASIIAKVTRDKIMIAYDKIYPQYEFGIHFGYPTKKHKEKIREFGATAFHRLTFSGVIETLNENVLDKWLKEGKISKKRYKAILKKREKLFKQSKLF